MASTGEAWRLGRRPALDGLRGVAILLVIASHYDHRYTTGGPVGVTVFFVLSGFLITSLLLEELARSGRLSLRGFYARRARRLFPALALVVLVVGALQTALGVPVSALIPVVFYVGNWATIAGEPMGFFKHTWSLSVEEQFYLLWPLVVLAALRLAGRRGVIATAAVGITVSVVARFVVWEGGAGAVHARFGSDTNAAGLLLGCLVAAWLHGTSYERRNRPGVAVALVVVLAVVAAGPSLTNYTLTAPLVTFAVAPLVVLLTVGTGPVGVFGNPVLRFIGRRSYGYYLWHAPVLSLCVLGSGARSPLTLAAAAAVTVAIAEVSWRLVEAPILRASRGRQSLVETVECSLADPLVTDDDVVDDDRRSPARVKAPLPNVEVS